MTKYDRMHARKEQRRAERENERKGKKENNKKKRAVYRKDGQGNIILWGWLKVTWVSIGMIIAIVAITSFLAVTLIMNEEELTEENCKNPFCRLFIGTHDPNDDMPFVPDLPNSTPVPEETGEWTLIPEAEARGEDEPVCYSPACKKKYDEAAEEKKGGSGTSEYEVNRDQKEAIMDEINERTKVIITKIKEKEAEVRKQRDLVPELKEKWLEQKDDLKGNDGELRGMEYKVKQMKKEYRDAYDDAETTEEVTEAKRLKEEYNLYLIEYETALADDVKEYEDVDTTLEEYDQAREDLEVLIEELRELRDEFQDLRIEMFKAKTSDQFINIRLSGTCLVLIENGYPTNCPTYVELKAAFDNTDPNFSGGFSPSESGNDIRRDVSPMQNYWNYYQQLPNWKIITVDPDAYIMTKGMLIEITAHHLKLKPDAETGIDFDENKIYVQHGISINKTCSHATVSPDMELIGLAVKQFFDRCNNPEDDWKTIADRPIYDVLKLDRSYNPLWLDAVLHGALGK